MGRAHVGPLRCWQWFPLTWVGTYRYELCNFLLYCTRILGPHLYMSALLFLHGIHVGVPGPTAHSRYLELLIYKVFHTAGSIPAAHVLVAELSVFTCSETRPLAIHSTALGASPLQEGKPAHRPRCWAPQMLGTPLNSGAQRHSLQVRQSPGVCKRRSHQSPQAGCPSRFPAPKPRCSEDGVSFSLFLHPVPDQNMFHKCWLNTPLRRKVLRKVNGKYGYHLTS